MKSGARSSAPGLSFVRAHDCNAVGDHGSASTSGILKRPSRISAFGSYARAKSWNLEPSAGAGSQFERLSSDGGVDWIQMSMLPSAFAFRPVRLRRGSG